MFISFLKGCGAISLKRCHVNLIIREIYNLTRETISINSKVNYAIILERLFSSHS